MSRREFLAVASAAGTTGMSLAAETQPAAATKPARQRWRIGMYTRPWAGQEYKAMLDAIAEAGFRHVGLMSGKTGILLSVATPLEEARKLGEEARSRGLQVISVYGGDIPVAESLKAGIAGMRKLIDNCVAAGSLSLLMGGVGDEKLYDPYYKAIAECCDEAAAKGLEITLKPHGGLNATGPQCRKAVERVNHRAFRLWYDAGNIFYYSDSKLDPVDDAATVDGLVTGLCVKDYRHPKNVEVTPGTGQVNFRQVLARLRQGGFTQGSLVIETLAPGEPPAKLAEARKARAFVEELVREVLGGNGKA